MIDLLKYIDSISSISKTCVECGAGSGGECSPTLIPITQKGFKGLWIEGWLPKFQEIRPNRNITAVYETITPDNICGILKQYNISENFGLMALDIDGYDFEVLQSLLKEFHPSVLHVEINEKIPWPIKFNVKYSSGYWWDFPSHFYGMSCTIAEEYLSGQGYDFVDSYTPDLLFIDSHVNKFNKITAKEYYENYKKELSKFSYNSDTQYWHDIQEPEILMNEIIKFYSDHNGKNYTGQYNISIGGRK